MNIIVCMDTPESVVCIILDTFSPHVVYTAYIQLCI